jgi:crossover junction endodeoxyribonuclease RusA
VVSPIRIETGWPAKHLSPNSRPNPWQLSTAKRKAKNEAFLATCSVVLPTRPQLGPGKLKVTIEAHPPVERRRDADNLVASCKAMLDGIAYALRVDDSQFLAPVVEWRELRPHGRLIFQIESLS